MKAPSPVALGRDTVHVAMVKGVPEFQGAAAANPLPAQPARARASLPARESETLNLVA